MASSMWPQAFLDSMRMQGDPLADDVIQRLFTSGEVGSVNELMRSLVENDDLPSNKLPVYMLEYLVLTQASVTRLDLDKLRLAQEVFHRFGPEVMMILGFYALPASYAARRGVQVLHRTGYLKERSVRRVFETAQMVVDVMGDGGLEMDGRGVRTLQKVRLIHAAIRHMLRHNAREPWDTRDLGLPVNQEDLAGTLMTFSFVVLEGMTALSIELTPAQRDAWIYTWTAIGYILGVNLRLLPENLEAARTLTFLIRERQVEASPEGVLLTASLLQGMRTIVPGFLEGLPATLVRFFLDQDQWGGLNVADMLQVPSADRTTLVHQAVQRLGGRTEWRTDNTTLLARGLRMLSKEFVEGMLVSGSGGRRAPFHIPAALHSRWHLQSSPRTPTPPPGAMPPTTPG